MVKLHAMVAFLAVAVVTFDFVNPANLRQHDTGRRLVTMEADESASSDFVVDEADASESTIDDRYLTEVDGSNLLGGSESSEVSDTSEDGSGLRLLVEVESNVDGFTPLDGINTSDDYTLNSDDDSEEDAESMYQPGTIRPAPIDEDTWGGREFDKSGLTWSR